MSGAKRIIADRRSLIATLILLALLVAALPALAITHGEPDGNDHPFVGSIVIRIPEEGLFQWCSGTLIASDVFLTAAHCIAPLDGLFDVFPDAEVLVTFDPTISPGGNFFTGQWVISPNFNGFSGKGGLSDPGDVAVILLDSAPGIAPASLPPAGMLDQLKADHILKDTRFTAVGYGTVRDTNRTGFQAIMANLDRNRSEQGFLSLTQAWLTLPMTPSNGNGGTCYGDSGGPHFIHLNGVETNIVASITVTGDAPCKATDKTYRMDTEATRAFLGNYVTLP
ncbi:MAG TPA: trypsin-like serine protease [Candidatus Sulfomarinibacteraceae bacterium]|nr:trypsin-like serine protease [Candidatus Sulfomarinibacteraceae bacterium]